MNRANRKWCEREFDVVQGLRTGSLSPELRDHVQSCVVCEEARSAAQLMLRTASLLRVEEGPPAADLVWRRAQARKQESDLKRATRPLIFMRALSIACVVFCAVRALHPFWDFVSKELMSGWNVMQGGAVGFVAAIAPLAIAIGAGYLLYDGRRSAIGIPST